MKPPFLRKKSDGYIYGYTDILAKRADMEPYYPPADTEQAGAEAAAVPADEVIPDPIAQEVTEDVASDEAPDFEAMHWKQLKRMVEDNGGEWINKESAITFLRGKQ